MLIVKCWVAELSHMKNFKINFIIILKTITWTRTKNLNKNGWKNVGPTHKSLLTLVTHCLHAVGGKMYFFCSCFTSLRLNNFKASKKRSESNWLLSTILLLSTIKLANFFKSRTRHSLIPTFKLEKNMQAFFFFSSWNFIICMREGM